ncbi:MAG: prenyltransferase/squalene oxidase repeat-containing protein [Dehalococcoidia bacterium]
MRRILFSFSAAVAALPILIAGAALPENDAVVKGSAYIYSTLAVDGSYGSTSPGQNMDAILAIRAAGYDPSLDKLPGGVTPADYLEANAAAVPNAAAAGKAALAAEALGIDPANVGGTDLIAKITGGYDLDTNRYGADDFSHALGIIGLACTGTEVGPEPLDALLDTQIDDGGWGFGGAADPDTTALALQALVAAGIEADDPDLVEALDYLKDAQLDDGSWGYDGVGNANSTALVVQALLALGEDPETPAYTKGAANPISYLLSQQLPDGSFEGFDPLFAANQVVPALAGRTFCNMSETPITRVREQVTPTPITTVPVPPTVTQTVVPTTVVPAPPPTGTGTAAGTSRGLPLAMVAGAILLTAGGMSLALRRR